MVTSWHHQSHAPAWVSCIPFYFHSLVLCLKVPFTCRMHHSDHRMAVMTPWRMGPCPLLPGPPHSVCPGISSRSYTSLTWVSHTLASSACKILYSLSNITLVSNSNLHHIVKMSFSCAPKKREENRMTATHSKMIFKIFIMQDLTPGNALT